MTARKPLEVAAHVDAGVEVNGHAAPAAPTGRNSLPVLAAPTQIRRPRRATIRTAFQALVALCAMAPVLVATTGLKADQLPWLAGVLAVAAAVTRVMALPQVEVFLQKFLPWLAAAPAPRPPGEDGAISRQTAIGAAVVALIIVVLLLLGTRP